MKAAQPGADQSPVIANSWLRREDLDAVPMLDLERRVRRVRRRASGILALVVVLAVALAVDAHAVIRDPALAIAPAAVLLCLAALATPLMRVGLRHGGDATIDELTGMLTRNALSLRVRELTAQSRMTGDPIGIVVGDLDHFSEINETRGREIGDFVLKEVAQQLGKQLRAFDLAYRIGGEEFLILLPGSELERAATVAETLRAHVSTVRAAGGVAVTMSFGVGASQAGEVFDYQAVLAMADAALYRAKHGGRDQVCRALPSELPQLGVPAFA